MLEQVRNVAVVDNYAPGGAQRSCCCREVHALWLYPCYSLPCRAYISTGDWLHMDPKEVLVPLDHSFVLDIAEAAQQGNQARISVQAVLKPRWREL